MKNKKYYSVVIKGKWHTWSFDLWAYPEYAEEWKQDGLQVDEIVNSIPEWWVNAGLPVKIWVFLQDILYH